MSRDVLINKNISIQFYITLLIFILILIYSVRHTQNWRRLLPRYYQNQISREETLLLKKTILNLPLFGVMMSVAGWFLGGLTIALSQFIHGMIFKDALLLFVHIFLIGGSFSVVISFYMSDSYVRKMISEIFPEGNFSNVKGVRNIRLTIRLMIAFWIGGILPVILLFSFSDNYIKLLIKEGYTDLWAFKYNILVVFVIWLSVFISIQSSYYYTKNFAKPLKELEKKMELVEQGDFNQRLAVNQKDEIGNVFNGFNNMTKGLKERERIKDIFGKFVSSNVRDEILKGNLELGGIKKEATILFCDIRNFTTLSEKLNPGEVIDLLNSYFNEMVKPILDNHGVIDKFIGDALMAVYGTPVDNPSHAKDALLSAITMTQKLIAFNQIRELTGQEAVAFGIGINTGEVIAGNIGSNDRMEYTVIGDAVNIASRLEGLTKEYQTEIIISQNTYLQLKDDSAFRFSELGGVVVKGRTKELKIYKVLLKG